MPAERTVGSIMRRIVKWSCIFNMHELFIFSLTLLLSPPLQEFSLLLPSSRITVTYLTLEDFSNQGSVRE